jgi:DNA polymerase elongation subunit (family B)
MSNYNKTWVVDIETFAPEDVVDKMDIKIEAKEKAKLANAKKVALKAQYGGRIACIGLYSSYGDEIGLMLDKDLSVISEQDMIQKFYDITDGCRISSYNGKSFDLPYIVFRGAILGVNSLHAKKKYCDKFKSDGHIDIFDEVKSDFKDMFSLNDIARVVLGCEKVEFDVTQIADKLKTDKGREEILQYCLKHENSDCKLTYRIGKKMGLL